MTSNVLLTQCLVPILSFVILSFGLGWRGWNRVSCSNSGWPWTHFSPCFSLSAAETPGGHSIAGSCVILWMNESHFSLRAETEAFECMGEMWEILICNALNCTAAKQKLIFKNCHSLVQFQSWILSVVAKKLKNRKLSVALEPPGGMSYFFFLGN